MHTLNGYTLETILSEMQRPLDANGYGNHPTKSYLTTINPAHTRERLTEIFGPGGFGWGLSWERQDTEYFTTMTAKKKERYHYVMHRATFWYVLFDDSGERHTMTIPTTGHSDNDNMGDAMAGARTSCISTAVKELLFQLHVYKDEPAPVPEKETIPVIIQGNDGQKNGVLLSENDTHARVKLDDGRMFTVSLDRISYPNGGA